MLSFCLRCSARFASHRLQPGCVSNAARLITAMNVFQSTILMWYGDLWWTGSGKYSYLLILLCNCQQKYSSHALKLFDSEIHSGAGSERTTMPLGMTRLVSVELGNPLSSRNETMCGLCEVAAAVFDCSECVPTLLCSDCSIAQHNLAVCNYPFLVKLWCSM